MFRLIVFDIDGVLTDGTIYVDDSGHEFKRISLRTFDALTSIKENGLLLAAITGEDTPVCDLFEKRIPWDVFLRGRKDKAIALAEVGQLLQIPLTDTVYIGDGKYDVPAISLAGLGVCPADACLAARLNADIILSNRGGECVEELLTIIDSKNRHSTVSGFMLASAFEKLKASRFCSFLRMFLKNNCADNKHTG